MRRTFPEWAERLVRAGDRPAKAMLLAVHAMGEAARPTLLALARGEYADSTGALPDGGWARVHAFELLAALPPDEPSLAVCLGAMRGRGRDGVTESAQAALVAWAPSAAPSLLAALRRSDDQDERMHLGLALSRSGVKSDEILQALLALLPERTDLAAAFLADYGDARALGALHEAFARCELESEPAWLGDQDVFALDDAITSLGGALRPAEKEELEEAKRRQRRHAKAMADALAAATGVGAARRRPSGFSLVSPRLDDEA